MCPQYQQLGWTILDEDAKCNEVCLMLQGQYQKTTTTTTTTRDVSNELIIDWLSIKNLID